jgi:hypothetical protein
MMTGFRLWAVGCAVLLGSYAAHAGKLANPSFEIDFGSREDLNMWGDFGEAWGETYQVYAGKERTPAKAVEGKRVILINVPGRSWNGTWQQIPWGENQAFSWQASYYIKGTLPESCSTFMKVEFYDASDNCIGTAEGERRRTDPAGKWVQDSMKGVTPSGTAAIRFVILAGDNTEGATIVDRIFWDNADTTE